MPRDPWKVSVDRLRDDIVKLATEVAAAVNDPEHPAARPSPATAHSLIIMLGDDIADLPEPVRATLRDRADQR